MQAYYEIETEISSNHQLNIQLPDTIPAGRAKIAVIYELAELSPDKNTRMAEQSRRGALHAPYSQLHHAVIKTYTNRRMPYAPTIS